MNLMHSRFSRENNMVKRNTVKKLANEIHKAEINGDGNILFKKKLKEIITDPPSQKIDFYSSPPKVDGPSLDDEKRRVLRSINSAKRKQEQLKKKNGVWISPMHWEHTDAAKYSGELFVISDRIPEYCKKKFNIKVGDIVLLLGKSEYDRYEEGKFISVLLNGTKIDSFKSSWIDSIESDIIE